MTSEDEPMPMATRPGAASASAPAHWAIVAGARVNAGTIAVPSRSVGAHALASASGVNASAPPASADQTSVYPRPGNDATSSRWACSGPPSGTVRPYGSTVASLIPVGLPWLGMLLVRRRIHG